MSAPRIFSPERAAELAVSMMANSELDEDTCKQLGFALAEAEQKWNAAKRADATEVTMSRLGLYVLLMAAARLAGMVNEKATIDPRMS